MYYVRFIINNYVNEHQLSHVVNTSHDISTTHINQSAMLLKLIGWRYCLCFKWVIYIPGTTDHVPDVEIGLTARYSVTVTLISLYEQ